jgi:hypothetical protein
MQTFIVVGPFVWGRGNTPDAARRIAARRVSLGKPMRTYLVYLVGKSTYINEFGHLCTAAGEPEPIELYRVENGKQVPAPDPAAV